MFANPVPRVLSLTRESRERTLGTRLYVCLHTIGTGQSEVVSVCPPFFFLFFAFIPPALAKLKLEHAYNL